MPTLQVPFERFGAELNRWCNAFRWAGGCGGNMSDRTRLLIALLVLGAMVGACGGSPQTKPGPTDMVIVPSTPGVVTPPKVVGDFRLIYPGDPSGAQLKYAQPPKAVSTVSEAAVVEKSDLFVSPTRLPPGVTLTSETATVGDGKVIGIDLYFSYVANGTHGGLQITRWAGLIFPVDIDAPLSGGGLTLEEGTISSTPAIFVKGKPNVLPENDIWFSRAGVVTFLRGTGPFDALVKIAESLP